MMTGIASYHQCGTDGSLPACNIKIIIIDLVGQLHHFTGLSFMRQVIAGEIEFFGGVISYMTKTAPDTQGFTVMVHYTVHLFLRNVFRKDLKVFLDRLIFR
jgi:hypothetical protein